MNHWKEISWHYNKGFSSTACMFMMIYLVTGWLSLSYQSPVCCCEATLGYTEILLSDFLSLTDSLKWGHHQLIMKDKHQPARNDSAIWYYFVDISKVRNRKNAMARKLHHMANKPKICSVWWCPLYHHLQPLNLTWTSCPGVCQQCMKCIQHRGRKIDRLDKELTVICDLFDHTLTYKGNPTAGGYTHAPTGTHAHSWFHQIQSGVTLHQRYKGGRTWWGMRCMCPFPLKSS